MAVGPHEMVDLEFLQNRPDEWSPSRACGISFLERGKRAENSEERQSRKNARRARFRVQNNAVTPRLIGVVREQGRGMRVARLCPTVAGLRLGEHDSKLASTDYEPKAGITLT